MYYNRWNSDRGKVFEEWKWIIIIITPISTKSSAVCVWKIMFVQRESEQQFAILNNWNRGSIPCNTRLFYSYSYKTCLSTRPFNSSETNQWTIIVFSRLNFRNDDLLFEYELKFLFFSSRIVNNADWSLNRSRNDDSRAAEQYKILVFYLFFVWRDILMRYRRWEQRYYFLSFFLF